MGEYATRKSDGEHIKIGTCESMYYLRFDDINKVEINYDLNQEGLSFRLPFPDEDRIQPGSDSYYELGYERSLRLLPYDDDGHTIRFELPGAEEHPGLFQLYHQNNGLTVNVKCFHGARLPASSDELRAFWNGKDPYPWELFHVKRHGNELLPLVKCRSCGNLFRTDWARVLPHIKDQELHRRLVNYANWTAGQPIPQSRSI